MTALIESLIAKQGAEVAQQGVSSRAIAVAVGHLYQAALALRSARTVVPNDVTQYLTPAMAEVVRQLTEAGKRRVAAVERAPSIIEQPGVEDKAAEFLREVNHNGGGVQTR